jgi:predicted amidophosphoribosyltransferase
MLNFYLGNILESNHIVILIIFLFIKSIMGIYAYRDSKKRNMQAFIWFLLVILIPNYIGLIIYLIVRQNDDYLNCPNCGLKVKRSYKVCPNCNQELTKICPVCKKKVKDSWNVCPYCTAILKDNNKDTNEDN